MFLHSWKYYNFHTGIEANEFQQDPLGTTESSLGIKIWAGALRKEPSLFSPLEDCDGFF